MDKLEELRDWIGELNWEGVGDVLSDVVDKIDELNRPLVVPKELAEWLAEQSLGEEGSLFSIIRRLEDMWSECDSLDFITDNKKELIEVILGNRGYEIEKEKLYYVINDAQQLVLVNIGHITPSFTSFEIAERVGILKNYQLTEEEIKKYDARYWPFAVEVVEKR